MATGQALRVTPLDLATQLALRYALRLLPYTKRQYTNSRFYREGDVPKFGSRHGSHERSERDT
jgi:hypothetical protein